MKLQTWHGRDVNGTSFNSPGLGHEPPVALQTAALLLPLETLLFGGEVKDRSFGSSLLPQRTFRALCPLIESCLCPDCPFWDKAVATPALNSYQLAPPGLRKTPSAEWY